MVRDWPWRVRVRAVGKQHARGAVLTQTLALLLQTCGSPGVWRSRSSCVHRTRR